ncbi:MAG TPA: signal peptidase I, partial [Rhizobiales bacterium]|nr:signal peptidase I [Hyphomicrobiales bacterium]
MDAQPVKKTKDEGIWETVKIVLQALVIAFFIRLVFFQPFNIPSGSMIPTLRIGDYLFVNKLVYGYGPYSLKFTAGVMGKEFFTVPDLPIKGRIFTFSKPRRGDVVVFKLPSNHKIDYIKRIIGLPGDKIQVIDSVLHINGKPVKRERIEDYIAPKGQGGGRPIAQYRETLPNGVSYVTHDLGYIPQADNTRV